MKSQIFNPYLPGYEYIPDVEPRIFGDRLYVYGSHDLFGTDDFCLGDYVCWSAPVNDLSDWRNEGVIYRKEQDPGNQNGKMHMCAPDVVQGADGRFYLYYQLHAVTYTSVSVCDTPAGKYEFYGFVRHKDGSPWGTQKGDVFVFDPGVLRDDDGKVYLYAGFSPVPGIFKSICKMRGNNVEEAVCLELAKDMITVIGKEKPVVPGHKKATGTEYEGHAFFEASSPRKINGKYYFVYSSELSHELCYAISSYPDREFHYGGTLISIGDIGFEGRTKADNYTGNTHGGMAQINGQWYIFYHRQTNLQKCARQGCAEKISILSDGSIRQVEMTSYGLNAGPLRGKGRYEARIACTLSSAAGTFPYVRSKEKNKKNIHPYFTQSGTDRETNDDQYIANMRNGACAGFKYFELINLEKIAVSVRGSGKGIFEVRTDPEGPVLAQIPVDAKEKYEVFSGKITGNKTGVYALYYTFKGTGYIDFEWFELF